MIWPPTIPDPPKTRLLIVPSPGLAKPPSIDPGQTGRTGKCPALASLQATGISFGYEISSDNFNEHSQLSQADDRVIERLFNQCQVDWWPAEFQLISIDLLSRTGPHRGDDADQ